MSINPSAPLPERSAIDRLKSVMHVPCEGGNRHSKGTGHRQDQMLKPTGLVTHKPFS